VYRRQLLDLFRIVIKTTLNINQMNIDCCLIKMVKLNNMLNFFDTLKIV